MRFNNFLHEVYQATLDQLRRFFTVLEMLIRRHPQPKTGKIIEAKAEMVCNIRKVIERARATTVNRNKSGRKLTRKKRTARWRRQLGKRAFIARKSRTRWAAKIIGKIAYATVSGPEDKLLTLSVIAPLKGGANIGELVQSGQHIPIDHLGYATGKWAGSVTVSFVSIPGDHDLAIAHVALTHRPGLFPSGSPTSVNFNLRRERAVRWGRRA